METGSTKTPEAPAVPGLPSSWQINLDGSRAGVIRDLKLAKTRPENADQRQLDSVKEYLTNEIGELSEQFNSVKVIASGELDPRTGRNVAHIEIYGINRSL